nr:NADH dehydrogenase subunit 2 [Tropiduchidae sp. 1 WQW-2023a]
MKMNSTKIMFMMILISSTLMMLSSTKMMFSWMMMELNFISFIPMMAKSNKMMDQTMKYLIIQSMASSIMVMSMILSSMTETKLKSSMMMMTSLMMKMGMIPFHLWMPMVMNSMNWNMCTMMATWQKLATTMAITQMSSIKMLIIPMCLLLIIPMCLSLTMGAATMTNQKSTKKMMAYSSISNSPWMIYSMMMSKSQFMMMFLTYCTLTIIIMNSFKKNNILYKSQITNLMKKKKMEIMMNILSMSGMPPFTGFIPKMMIISSSINQSMVITASMIISSILSSFSYMKFTSNVMMTNSSQKKSTKKNKFNSYSMMFNMMGTPMMMMNKMIN